MGLTKDQTNKFFESIQVFASMWINLKNNIYKDMDQIYERKLENIPKKSILLHRVEK